MNIVLINNTGCSQAGSSIWVDLNDTTLLSLRLHLLLPSMYQCQQCWFSVYHGAYHFVKKNKSCVDLKNFTKQ